MWSSIASIFTGGIVKSVENIAKEWIDTPEEKAKASALMIKTLDPNGLMRRQISSRVSMLYTVYIFTMMILLLAQAFSLGDAGGLKSAIDSMVGLFVPTTTMFTMIVSASFGVNAVNSVKGNDDGK